MKDCKDCRYYRPSMLPVVRHRFARCTRPGTTAAEFGAVAFAEIEREFDFACGPGAAHFEQPPLGKSHGIDWDRAGKIAEGRGRYRESFHLYADGVEVKPAEAANYLCDPYSRKIQRTRFTIAEYLAALTTDYCAHGAAE